MRIVFFLYFLSIFTFLPAQSILNPALKSRISDNTLTETFDVLITGNIQKIIDKQQQYGVKIKYFAGDVACAEVSVNAIVKLTENKLVKYIEYIPPHNRVLNDTMIVRNRIKNVKLGTTPLTQAYDGSGVIVGIIDSGIDWSNPDFKDNSGNTRIRFLWDQSVANGTNIPQPFNYGNEWTAAMINATLCTHTDVTYWGHGTHVSGIAAGNGKANGTHEGVAPKADIILVALDFSKPGPIIADGVQYIVNKATSLNKPFVINASVGDYYGSHDGTNSEAKLIDALIANIPGRAMVAAAGNAGSIKFHTKNFVNLTDTNFTWFTNTTNTLEYWLYADSSAIKAVKYSIGVNRPNFADLGRIGFKNYNYGFTLKTDTLKFNSKRIGIVQSASSINADGVYELYVKIKADSLNYLWRIESNGSGVFDAWNFDFVSTALPTATVYPKIVKYTMPDSVSSMVSSFQCSNEIITVANYVNLNKYYDVNNTLQTTTETTGALAASSSCGPTRTGKMKPDVSASGASIFSSIVLSMQSNLITNFPSSVAQGSFHVLGGGTSASSPVVAGLATLLLQAHPNFTNKQVKAAITNCTYSDAFTGSVPNYKWGYGKLDGFNTFICSIATGVNSNYDKTTAMLFPNPTTGTSVIKFGETIKGSITILNSIGELISEGSVNSDEYIVQDNFTASAGIYYISVKSTESNYFFKLIVLQ